MVPWTGHVMSKQVAFPVMSSGKMAITVIDKRYNLMISQNKKILRRNHQKIPTETLQKAGLFFLKG